MAIDQSFTPVTGARGRRRIPDGFHHDAQNELTRGTTPVTTRPFLPSSSPVRRSTSAARNGRGQRRHIGKDVNSNANYYGILANEEDEIVDAFDAIDLESETRKIIAKEKERMTTRADVLRTFAESIAACARKFDHGYAHTVANDFTKSLLRHWNQFLHSGEIVASSGELSQPKLQTTRKPAARPPTDDQASSRKTVSFADVTKAAAQQTPGDVRIAPTRRQPVAARNYADRRILLRLKEGSSFFEKNSFQIRLALKEKLALDTRDIQDIKPTNTGWALSARNEEIQKRIIESQGVWGPSVDLDTAEKHVAWHTYLIKDFPSELRSYDDSILDFKQTIGEEIIAQTGQTPVQWRRSKRCQATPRCANCYGPHHADYEQCYARPKKVADTFHKLSKSQKIHARKLGADDYRRQNMESMAQSLNNPTAQNNNATTTGNTDVVDTEMAGTAEDSITIAQQEDYLSAVGGDEDMIDAEQEQLRNNEGAIEEEENVEIGAEEVPDGREQADEGENATEDVDEGEGTEEEGEDETDDNEDEDKDEDDNDTADERGDTRQSHQHEEQATRNSKKLAFLEGYSVVILQEPNTSYNKQKQLCRTQYHPGFLCFSPVDSWSTNDTRPRVMTYVKIDSKIQAEQISPTKHRDLLWVRVNGVTILNIYNRPEVKDTLKALEEWTPPENCVVAGDMNASHTSWQSDRPASQDGNRIHEWTERHDLHLLNEPDEKTTMARCKTRSSTIDLAFSNIPEASATVEVHLTTGSLHYTIGIEIPYREPARTVYGKIRVTTPDEIKAFGDHVGKAVKSLPTDVDSQAEIENMTRQLQEILQNSAKACGRVSRGHRARSCPWWDQECKDAHDDLRITRRIYENQRGEEVQRARVRFCRVLRRARQNFWRKTINEVTTPGDVFKLTRWMKPKQRLQPPPIQVGDTTYSTDMEKAMALRKEKLERRDASDDITDAWQPAVSPARDIPFARTISTKEIEKAVLHTGNTTPGSDGITTKMLQAAWSHIAQPLTTLYNACLRLGHHPSVFKVAEVVMIPKLNKRNLSDVSTWRPISLLSCLSKGLERVIARRMAYAAIKYSILHPNQAGALPKRSAVDIVVSLIYDIEKALAAGKVATLVTEDVMGAFDAILRNRMILRLRQQGWPDFLIRWIASFLLDRLASRFSDHIQVEGPRERHIKEKAVADFEQWLAGRPAGYVVFSDGSKTDTDTAGYGFAVFHHGQLLDWGSGQLGQREVFDAEIHGALAGLKAAMQRKNRLEPITVCMDNTSVIDCIGATAADSSQACFRDFQKIGDEHPYLISVKWSPGHTGIF
ncbi:hypothetical protein MY5147_009760, partial [Beauveria neobassiana]